MRTLFLLLSALCSLIPAFAQSTSATLTGSVQDPSGAFVPNATIEVTNTATGYVYRAASNEAGIYTVPNLVEGPYKLKAAAGGFQDFKVENIVLTARDLRRVDITFQVGQSATTIDVTAGVTLIETETARVADVRDRQTMIDTPLSLRRSWDFIQLSPNVSKTKSGFNIRFGGSRTRQGDVTVDGVSISNVFGGQITGVVTDRTESYGEMRLEVAGSTAETPGVGQMAIVTRSGSNQLRGEVFNYYTSPGLSARNPFSPAQTASIEWVPGGSIGGPIYIPKIYNGENRSFFFTSLEFERFGPPSPSTMNTSVPIETWRRGDFSGLLPGTVIRDPFNANAPFPNNSIPASRLNPASLKLQERFYPLPNFGSTSVFTAQNNRTLVFSDKLINPTWVTRIDHRITERIYVNGRFTIVRWPQNPFVGSLPTIGRTERKRKNNGLSFGSTVTLRPNMLLELRYGIATDAFPETPPQRGVEIVRELGFRGLAPDLPDVGGTPTINFTNLGLTGISNNVECNPCNEYQKHSWQGTLSWFSGRHSVKSGVQVGKGRYTDTRQNAGVFGNQTFSNRFTGHTYADFLLGIPTTMSRAFPSLGQSTTAYTYGFFVQDEYRIRPDLTLNFGIRYDLLPGFTARDGMMSLFDIDTASIIIPDGASEKISTMMPRGYVPIVEASKAGYQSSRLLNADKNNFSPRVGFAWRPLGNNTVFRGGFGLYYDIAAKNAPLSTVPFNIAEPAYTNPTDNPLVWPTVFPAAVGGPASVSLPGALNRDLRIPYSMQYNFTVERQQWNTGFRVSYIGTNTRQGVWGFNVNQPVADTRAFIDKPRRFPQFPNINYLTNGAGHQYHAGTIEVSRPLSNGLRLQAYYTLARDIGDLEDGESPEDAYNRERERSVWSDVPTHRFSTNMTYELPFGKGKPLLAGANSILKTAVSGWQIGAVYTTESGNFLTPSWTGPDPTGTRFTNNRTAPNVTIRPDILRNPNLDERTIARWYDTTAFASPQPGRFGTSAKGVIIGPGTNVLHLNTAKVTKIKERYTLRLEAVATNAMNHPNYVDPNLNISDLVGAGLITNVVNRNTKMDMAIPRVLQLIVRIQF